jgi:hypothetical protein
MKIIIISALVIFGPLLGTALLFWRTVRRELRSMAGRVTLDTELLDMLAPNEDPPRFEEILDLCPALRTAYYRFAKLDANGACCVFNEVHEAYEDGVFDSMCDKLASDLNAASDALESGVNDRV